MARPFRTPMSALATIACAAALPLAVQAAPAGVAAAQGVDALQRNGSISRHLWQPEFATLRVGGLQLSPGVALGLREGVRANLGTTAASALSVRLARGSTLSLLAGRGGVMLALQTEP